MIVVDIETTSLSREYAQLTEMGAIHYETGEEFFLKSRPSFDLPLLLDPESFKYNGTDMNEWLSRTEEPNQKETVQQFIDWSLSKEEKPVLGGHNIGSFDCMVLCRIHTGSFNMNWPLGHRQVDIHSIFYSYHRKSMNSDSIAEHLGLPKEARPHTGIGGARHEYRIFKNLFGEN